MMIESIPIANWQATFAGTAFISGILMLVLMFLLFDDLSNSRFMTCIAYLAYAALAVFVLSVISLVILLILNIWL